MTGHIVFAAVLLSTDESLADFRVRMRAFCATRLQRYKIPQKIELVQGSLHGDRFKKIRRARPS